MMPEATMFDEFFRQRSDLVEASKTPVCVLFSPEGELRARRERGEQFGFDDAKRAFTHYAGLPFYVMQQASEMIVSDALPVLHKSPITVHMHGLDPGQKPTYELLGSKLTKAQLSDVIDAWVEANPDEPTASLEEWVREHGRFE